MSETATKELGEFDAVTPASTDNLICGRGRFTVAQLVTVIAEQIAADSGAQIMASVMSAFNGGTSAIGRCAISPTTKKIYIFCSDSLWHELIPVSDGTAQMPAISEEGIENVL